MRNDIQKIFKFTPHQKQVMMFSATLSEEVRGVCKRFMHNVCSLFTLRESFFFLKGCLKLISSSLEKSISMTRLN